MSDRRTRRPAPRAPGRANRVSRRRVDRPSPHGGARTKRDDHRGGRGRQRPGSTQKAEQIAPGIAMVDDVAALLKLDLDGIVIATPSALHAEQAIAALNAGVAVFCQKPLGRTACEVRRTSRRQRRVIDASGSIYRTGSSPGPARSRPWCKPERSAKCTP